MSKNEVEKNIEELARVHEAARSGRRRLEAELASMEGEIKAAIAAGDGVALSQLGRRKRELPFLIGEASALEHKHFSDELAARRRIPVAHIPGAEAALEEARRRLVERQAEHEQEIAALQSEVVKAQQEVARLYGESGALSDTLGRSRARFKEELARLNS
jgi:phage shock protein A